MSNNVTLHIFNPEHDMALAAHLARFTAPRAGRELRHDLGFLPALWAADGDLILVDDLATATEGLRPLGPLAHGTLTDRRGLAQLLHRGLTPQVEPWGWDLAVRQQLADCGMPAHRLPTAEQIGQWRMVSHRAWAASRLLPRLREIEGTIGEAYAARSTDELRALLARRGTAVLKAPWSSSGRGLRYLREVDGGGTPHLSDAVSHWAANIIDRQQAVMVEPCYERTADLAMEFVSDGRGKVAYAGLSLFATERGAYTGNVLDDEATKLDRVGRWIDPALTEAVRQRLIALTAAELGSTYAGPFGIDMMVVRTPAGMALHPCVELNLRRTMGHVALALTAAGQYHHAAMQIVYAGHYRLRISQQECDR